MSDMRDYERRQSVADKVDQAHMLANVTAAQLLAHANEDQRIFKTITDNMSTLTEKVDGISKWIWIATGVMLALSKGLDFLINRQH